MQLAGNNQFVQPWRAASSHVCVCACVAVVPSWKRYTITREWICVLARDFLCAHIRYELMCLWPPLDLVRLSYKAIHYMVVWWSNYAVWASCHVQRLLDSCRTSNMLHFLVNLSLYIHLSPCLCVLLCGTPRLSSHFCKADTEREMYQTSNLIISVKEILHLYWAFLYLNFRIAYLFGNTLLVCSCCGVSEAPIAADCFLAVGKFVLSNTTLW